MKRIYLIIALLMPFTAYANIDSYYSVWGFQLEETKLSEISNMLGEAPLHKEGDAANSYSAICYYYPSNNMTVYFEGGEFGGGKDLLSIKVINKAENEFPCLNKKSRKPENNFNLGALEIGKKAELVILELEKTFRKLEDGTFSSVIKIPFSKEDIEKTGVQDMKIAFWDQQVNIELFTENNIVIGYRVHKITTW